MNEYIDLIKGRLPEPQPFEEVFAFSVHKAGSTLMHNMITEVCRPSDVSAFSIPDLMFLEGYSDEWQTDPKMCNLFSAGRVYHGFRNLPPFMKEQSFNLRQKCAVLLVRDPRDALVSQYYSFGGKYISHKMPEKNKDVFLNRYKRTADLEIDEYVQQAAKDYFGKLNEYSSSLNFNKVLLRRYEDIFLDKKQFLADIFDHFRLEIDPVIIEEVASRNDIRPKSEDISRHIRKGFPGDHREKLKPETIRNLNEIFHDLCSNFGYDLKAS